MSRHKDRISCAYCGEEFDGKEEWLGHIPCPESRTEVSDFDVGRILPNVKIID